jgi:hypothetical protein
MVVEQIPPPRDQGATRFPPYGYQKLEIGESKRGVECDARMRTERSGVGMGMGRECWRRERGLLNRVVVFKGAKTPGRRRRQGGAGGQ